MNLQNAHKEMVEWMTAFGQECPKESCIPYKNLALRHKLILEESDEVLAALDDLMVSDTENFNREQTFNDTIDGLGDSLFVIIGTFVALGVDTQAVWNEILKSNWTKFWTGEEVTKDFNLVIDVNDSDVWEYHSKLRIRKAKKINNIVLGRNWLVKNEHGKVIKSPSFTPPNLKQFIPKELQQ